MLSFLEGRTKVFMTGFSISQQTGRVNESLDAWNPD